jgi:hypothetical protein
MRLVWALIPLVLIVSMIGIGIFLINPLNITPTSIEKPQFDIEEKQQHILNNPKISDGLKHLLIYNQPPINKDELKNSEILEITIAIIDTETLDVIRKHLIEIILFDPTGVDTFRNEGQFLISGKVNKQKILEIAELDYVKRISFWNIIEPPNFSIYQTDPSIHHSGDEPIYSEILRKIKSIPEGKKFMLKHEFGKINENLDEIITVQQDSITLSVGWGFTGEDLTIYTFLGLPSRITYSCWSDEVVVYSTPDGEITIDGLTIESNILEILETSSCQIKLNEQKGTN